MKTYHIVVALFTLLAGAACTHDYQSINTNPLLPTEDMKSRDGVAAGAYFLSFQKNVIPTRSSEGEGTDLPNRYQIAINLAGDNWVGYMSPMNNKWNGGQNFVTGYMLDGWVGYAFSTFFSQIANPWMQILAQTHNKEVANGTVIYHKKALADQAVYSVAQIIKVMGLHRATDTYGPLPYTALGNGDLTPEYDSQEVIYKRFFEELETAINTLQEYQRHGGNVIESLVDSDAVYQGEVAKWVKLANSLMLRLAVRVRYVDAELSKTWAQKAVSNPGGLIESVSDIAMLQEKNGKTFINSLPLLWDNYDDCRMGATIYCYLKGYNDPRKDAYFTHPKGGKGELKAVRTGIPTSASPDQYKEYSVPNVQDKTPVYWFKASETFFLRAEAALFGLIAGDAKTLYERGIETSFAENGVAMPATYLRGTTGPAAYTDAKAPEYNAARPSNVSVSWSAANSAEEKLEKIITQKYLAIFPDGQEAWTEWRRTGYPRQVTAYTNRTDALHGNLIDSDGYKRGVRRMIYPRSEYNGINKENLAKGLKLLSTGVDDCNTRLWWDANPLLD